MIICSGCEKNKNMKISNGKVSTSKDNNSDKRDLNDLGLLVADHVPAMLAYWDKNQICRFANNAYREWFGRSREEMVDKITMKELLGPLYEKNYPHIIAVLEGKPQVFEREIPLPGGAIRHSIANYIPDIENGEVRGFFVHVADVTTIKELEFELRASEMKFKGLLESAPDAIVIVNKEGIIQIVNAESKRMFGYSESELLGKPVEILIPENLRQKHVVHRTNYFLNPKTRPMGIDLELLAVHKNEKEFPVEISLGPMETKDGILVSAAIRDITWKVQKQKQLVQSMEIIRNQNKQLLNFAYIVSHNLKSYSNNLASILNMLSSAQSESEKDEMVGFLKNISSSFSSTVEHLNEIVEVQNKGYLERSNVKLRKYIEKVIDSLSIQIKTTGTVIYNDVDENIMINYNEAYLESILQNFLTNAIKYRNPGRRPEIKISTFLKDEIIILQIKDNGKGINLEKYGDKLFGMYKTFHGNPDAKGIGLFITKYQVEAMGGHIEVHSKEGEGTEFNIFFGNK